MSFALTRRSAMLGAVAATAAVAAPTLVLGQRAAHATTIGRVGRITFKRGLDIWIADADGGNARLLVANTKFGSGNWSPDGSRFVYASANSGPCSIRPDGTGNQSLTPGTGGDYVFEPVYAYGGRYVIYSNFTKLSIVSAGGTSRVGEQLISIPDDGRAEGGAAVASDGTIVFQRYFAGGGNEAEIYRIDGFTTVTKIIERGWNPDFSPDSTKLAFQRNTAGTNEHHIWIADADGSNQVQLTTTANTGSMANMSPVWSPDGQYILFTSDANVIKRIDVTTKAVVTITEGSEPTWQPVTDNIVERVWGQTALGTAVATSRYNWADHGVDDGVRAQAKAVVLSRDDLYFDALGGSALAVAKQGPLLITPSDWLHPDIQAEIQRVLGGTGTVYLLGGTLALTAKVEITLKNLGYDIVRLWGQDEYATAVAVAKEIAPNPDAVILATSLKYYDALAAGAAAGANPGTVIVLTAGDTMPAATAAYLNTLNPDYQAGGTAMIGVGGPGVRALLGGYLNNQMPSWPDEINYFPVYGATEFETAIAVAEFFFDPPRTAAVATASTWYDALTGGAMIGANFGPLLLSAPGTLSAPTRDYFSRNSSSLKYATLLGGPLALQDTLIPPLGNAIGVPDNYEYRQYTDTWTPSPGAKTLTADGGGAPRHGVVSGKAASAIPGTKRRKPETAGN